MRLTAPLNEWQLQVLRWIADGCPTGVMTGYTYKITARALHSRRLVKVSNSGGTWSATVTDAGTHYLRHRCFPPTKPTPPSSSSVPTEDRSHCVATRRQAPSTTPSTQPLEPSPTAKLVADVIAAGGTLKAPQDWRRTGRRLDELVRNANRYGKAPPGMRLVHNVVYDGEGWTGTRYDVVMLVEGPAGTDAPLLPVPLPREISRYHPAVSALRKSNRVAITGEARTRALRILHALAVESERRGYTITPHTPKANNYKAEPAWHLLVTVASDVVPLRISEETDRVEHVPTARELAVHERNPWIRIPSHDVVDSGRLRIELGGLPRSDRRSSWADRTAWSLEDKLPEVLREVAVRADELRLRREAKARAEEEYRQAVEHERQRARVRAADVHRRAVLDDQMTQWHQACELRLYAAALEKRITAAEANEHATNEGTSTARRWLAWVTDLAEQQDPTRLLPGWPTAPDLPTYELSKFMNRVPEPPEMHYQPATY